MVINCLLHVILSLIAFSCVITAVLLFEAKRMVVYLKECADLLRQAREALEYIGSTSRCSAESLSEINHFLESLDGEVFEAYETDASH